MNVLNSSNLKLKNHWHHIKYLIYLNPVDPCPDRETQNFAKWGETGMLSLHWICDARFYEKCARPIFSTDITVNLTVHSTLNQTHGRRFVCDSYFRSTSDHTTCWPSHVATTARLCSEPPYDHKDRLQTCDTHKHEPISKPVIMTRRDWLRKNALCIIHLFNTLACTS